MGKEPSDSDSSDGNEDEYTETSVLLGYASKEVTEDPVSHIGGLPVCYYTF
jgi:pre-rRNA-processing protein TSR4